VVLSEVMVTQCTGRAVHLLGASSPNSACRLGCQQQSPYRQLSSFLWKCFMKPLFCFLFNVDCYIWTLENMNLSPWVEHILQMFGNVRPHLGKAGHCNWVISAVAFCLGGTRFLFLAPTLGTLTYYFSDQYMAKYIFSRRYFNLWHVGKTVSVDVQQFLRPC
jgi:hypothetical protein